jgi:hypothetical protein
MVNSDRAIIASETLLDFVRRAKWIAETELDKIRSLMRRLRPPKPPSGSDPDKPPPNNSGSDPDKPPPSPKDSDSNKASSDNPDTKRGKTSTLEKGLPVDPKTGRAIKSTPPATPISQKIARRAKGHVIWTLIIAGIAAVGTYLYTGDSETAKQVAYETANPLVVTTEVLRGNLDIPLSDALFIDLLRAAHPGNLEESRETREISEEIWEYSPVFNPAHNPKY